MMRSLYSGISGLRNHQTRMDVIGNNIANVNTTGYKTSRVIFQDIFSQNVSSGMSNNQLPPRQPGEVGGTNPLQIGLGIRLSTVDVMHTPAPFQRTDNPTDMMINGDGYFIVRGPEGPFYTRAGNFYIDNDGYLVNAQGFYVMGYNYELITDVIDLGSPAIAAGSIEPGSPAVGEPGTPGYEPAVPPIPATNIAAVPPKFGLVAREDMRINDEYEHGLSRIRLNAFQIPPAQLENLTTEQLTAYFERLAEAPDPENPPIGWFDEFLYGTELEPSPFFVDYDNPVSLTGMSVADDGAVSVIIGNRKVVIGTVAIAMFANPAGLEKAGNSLYRESASSGPVVPTVAYLDGAGRIDGGGLEMSNVDLASEFTDMIVTQRGFQANSRIITVSDTMLEELVNLKR